MIIRFRNLETHMISHLLLPSPSSDSHLLHYNLLYIFYFIMINMPVRYGPLEIRDKSPNPPQPDTFSTLLAFAPSQMVWFLSILHEGLVSAFIFLLGIFHIEIFFTACFSLEAITPGPVLAVSSASQFLPPVCHSNTWTC